MYNANNQIKFKTSMIRSRLYDYSDAYLVVTASITVTNILSVAADPKNRKKYNNCAPFTNCIKEMNNIHFDNAKYNDMVMSMHNLIEYSDNYPKTSSSLWNYYRDEPFLNADGANADFPANNHNSASFKLKTKIAGGIGNDSTKNVKTIKIFK